MFIMIIFKFRINCVKIKISNKINKICKYNTRTILFPYVGKKIILPVERKILHVICELLFESRFCFVIQNNINNNGILYFYMMHMCASDSKELYIILHIVLTAKPPYFFYYFIFFPCKFNR